MSVWPNGTISKFVCLSQGGDGMGEPSQRKTLVFGEARGAANDTHGSPGLEPQARQAIINACLGTSLLRFMAWIEDRASVAGFFTKTEKAKINER